MPFSDFNPSQDQRVPEPPRGTPKGPADPSRNLPVGTAILHDVGQVTADVANAVSATVRDPRAAAAAAAAATAALAARAIPLIAETV